MKISSKITAIGVGGVLTTAIVLVGVGIWQGSAFRREAQNETTKLVDADLNHITAGIVGLVKTEDEGIREDVDHAMHVARYLFDQIGKVSLGTEQVPWKAVNQFSKEAKDITLPRFMVGKVWIQPNADLKVETPIVDLTRKLTGSAVTLFQRINEQGDMLRVATNVESEDGKRPIGTYIPAINPDGKPNPVVASVMNGATYRGNAFVVNKWYVSAYEPLLGTDGKIVGMLYVGYKQESLPTLRQSIMGMKVGTNGSVSVLGGKGTIQGKYLISKDGARDGENAWEEKDADGRPITQIFVNKALALAPGQIESERYRVRDAQTNKEHWRIARIAYYAPWDWVIVIGADEEDFAAVAAQLSAGQRHMMWMFLAAAFVLALLGGWLCWQWSRKIGTRLGQMVTAAEALSQGDTQCGIEEGGSDEVGELAAAFRKTAGYMQHLTEASTALASGNLTHHVAPCSEKDALGAAFVRMVENMRLLLGTLSDNAAKVTATGENFASSCAETAQGAEAVALAIQKVAAAAGESSAASKGIARDSGRQADAVSETNRTIQQLSHVIQQVQEGGQQQRTAAEQAENGAETASRSIQEVLASSEQMEQAARQASSTAQSSGKALQETVATMSHLKDQVEASAAKVRELGSKSQQIGAIVQTIEDIAEQTNLLALNAAIEAARAGEQGRGFAVVAEEVRKLAERSAASTREIGQLIGSVRAMVEEAVQAITSSSVEASKGAERSQESGRVLTQILDAISALSVGIESVTVRTREMVPAVQTVRMAVEAVRDRAAQNEAAMMAMSQNAETVQQAMRMVAEISEETASRAQQMNASAEEVAINAQNVLQIVEEQTCNLASVRMEAAELNAMTAQVQTLVSQFRCQTVAEEVPPVFHKKAA